MTLPKINPTKTAAWNALEQHFQAMQSFSLKEAFLTQPNRKTEMTISGAGFELDFSKNLIEKETLSLLVDLADQVDLKKAIASYFGGETINETEQRAVLHTALRANSKEEKIVEGENISEAIAQTLNQIKGFTEKVINGEWKGYTGKPITHVVNIGIGGSDLGPCMVVDALKYDHNHLQVSFMSNVDGDHAEETLKHLNPETTLFVVVSKTFTTQETMSNAQFAKKWFLQNGDEKDIAKHFVAVSTNLQAVSDFGIADQNIFTMWNWVGGRFSLWSAVGLSIALAVGFEKFEALLAGAKEMDDHFRNASFNENLPVVMALLSIWYNNFHQLETEAVLPYTQYLEKLVPYLQQAIMESNGKGVDRNGEAVDYQTGTIVWGSHGTNMQHAFMQLVHQGTKIIPCDFIGFQNARYGNKEQHDKLMANFYAQSQALLEGKSEEAVHLDLKLNNASETISKLLPYKVFTGNRPSNSLMATQLNPHTLGALIALYEHKIFVQGIVWNIFSYDQFGVELGKELAKKIAMQA